MISKELFVETVNFLREQHEAEDLLNDVLKKLCDDSIIYGKSHGVIFNLLEEAMNVSVDDYGSILSWWLYERDYGRTFKIGDYVGEDGSKPDLSTAELLYNYIVTQVKE